MKTAIYIRVSRSDLNLDNQKLPLVKYAEREGWEYEIFQEKESTRKTRPIQDNLYRRLCRKEFDVLLVYKFDRWARSVKELVLHMEEFTMKGVRFISYHENVDLGTPTGRLMFQIIGAMAEFEREIIRERTIAGLERAKAWGKKLGRPRKTPPEKDSVSTEEKGGN